MGILTTTIVPVRSLVTAGSAARAKSDRCHRCAWIVYLREKGPHGNDINIYDDNTISISIISINISIIKTVLIVMMIIIVKQNYDDNNTTNDNDHDNTNNDNKTNSIN